MTSSILVGNASNIKPLIDPAINPETGRRWSRNRKNAISPAHVEVDATTGRLTFHRYYPRYDCFGNPVERVAGAHDDQLLSRSRDAANDEPVSQAFGCGGCPSRDLCGAIVRQRIAHSPTVARLKAQVDAETTQAGVDLRATQARHLALGDFAQHNTAIRQANAERRAHPAFRAFAKAVENLSLSDNRLEVRNAKRATDKKAKRAVEKQAQREMRRDPATRSAIKISNNLYADRRDRLAATKVVASAQSQIAAQRETKRIERVNALTNACRVAGAPLWLRNLEWRDIELTSNVWAASDALYAARMRVTSAAVAKRLITLGQSASAPDTLRGKVTRVRKRIDKLVAASIWPD